MPDEVIIAEPDDVLAPVPVTGHVGIRGDVPTAPKAADFGGWATYTLAATTAAQKILPYDELRARALIICSSPGTAGSSTPAVNSIPLAASGVASYNNNATGVNLTISGGTVTVIAINGTTTGLTSGTFFVPAGGTVTVTYSVAPTTFTTAGIAVATAAVPGVVFVGSKAQCQASPALGGQVPNGAVAEVKNKQELWLAPDGTHAATVTVLLERWAG